MSTETTPPPWEEAARQVAKSLEPPRHTWPAGETPDHDRAAKMILEPIKAACLAHAAAVTRERDEARAQVEALKVELEAAITELSQRRLLVEVVEEQRNRLRGQLETAVKGSFDASAVMATENAALRAQVERMRTALESVTGRIELSSWGQAGTFRISHAQFGDRDLAILKEALAPTPPPAAGTEAKTVCEHGIRSPHYCGECDEKVQAGLVSINDVEPLLVALTKIASFGEGSAVTTSFDEPHSAAEARGAIAAYRAKHPKPEAKGTE